MPPASTTEIRVRTLWLARHGESTWNTLGLTQGHNDQAELTARGKRQAAEVAERFAGLPVRAVYASDLRRARQTAAPLAAAAGLPVVLDARLRERNLGVLEGTHAVGDRRSVTGVDLDAGQLVNPDARPDGGESVRDLYRRAAAFCEDLRTGTLPALGCAGAETGTVPDTRPDLDRDPEPGPWPGDVVVVAHGGTLRVLRAYLTGVPVERMEWTPLANATVLKFPYFGTTTREGDR